MPSDDSARTRRRLLESLGAVGLAGFGASAGVTALYSDRAESGGVLASGSVELVLGRGRITVDPRRPGDAGVETVSVTNEGSLDGVVDRLRLAVFECETEDSDAAEDRPCEGESDVDNAEGNRSGDGSNGDTAAGSPSNGERLASYLRLRIGFDPSGSGDSADAVTVVGPVTLAELSLPETYETACRLASGAETQLFVAWKIDEDAPTAAAVGETGLTIDLHFRQS